MELLEEVVFSSLPLPQPPFQTSIRGVLSTVLSGCWAPVPHGEAGAWETLREC